MKVRVPLEERTVAGIDCPFPLVRLRVRDRFGATAVIPFRVDTAADITAIPIDLARQQAIPFQEQVQASVVGLVGRTKKYRDRIRLVIAGREHDWPCDFVEVPAELAGKTELLPVLGRAGFLDEYAVAIDAGFVVITRLGPVRRALRRWLHWLWAATGRIHSAEEPL